MVGLEHVAGVRARDRVDDHRGDVDLAGREHGRGTLAHGGDRELVAVDPLAGQRDEEPAGPDLRGVELDRAR